MAQTTFQGPVKSGPILNTTGTTLGQDVADVGNVVLSQSSDVVLTHATTAATALGIVLPAQSQILSIALIMEQLFANSNTTTIAIGNASGTPTNIAPATQVSASALNVSLGQAAVDAWVNTGSNDIELYGITVANSATAGKARVVVTYVQGNNLIAQ